MFLSLANENLEVVGTIFPNKYPQGFKDSIWSNITLTMAVKGMERNIPGIPHIAPPIKTTMIETRALILTRDATIFGMT